MVLELGECENKPQNFSKFGTFEFIVQITGKLKNF